MRTIAIVNLKGGVGKTVTAVNMASILATDHGRRVLLIDADSQGNTTEFFGADPAGGSLADLLMPNGWQLAPVALAQDTDIFGLQVLPASDALMDLDLSAIALKRVNISVLQTLVMDAAERGLYDFIIVDCPPAFNAASAAALMAADDVIIPIKLDAFSLRGMANLMRQVANMRRLNPQLRVAGCVVTMWHKTKQLVQALEQLEASDLPVFRAKIRTSLFVDSSTFVQQPLHLYSPHCAAGVDYRRLMREYLKQIGGGRK